VVRKALLRPPFLALYAISSVQQNFRIDNLRGLGWPKSMWHPPVRVKRVFPGQLEGDHGIATGLA
jgi:hypothetical protein